MGLYIQSLRSGEFENILQDYEDKDDIRHSIVEFLILRFVRRHGFSVTAPADFLLLVMNSNGSCRITIHNSGVRIYCGDDKPEHETIIPISDPDLFILVERSVENYLD